MAVSDGDSVRRWGPSRWGRAFTRSGAWSITLDDGYLTLAYAARKNGWELATRPIPAVRTGMIWSSALVDAPNGEGGTPIVLRGLSRADGRELERVLEESVAARRRGDALDAMVTWHRSVTDEIESADRRAVWIPLSRTRKLERECPPEAQVRELVGALEDSCRGTARESFSPEALRAALALAREGARAHIEIRNERYTLDELERLAPRLDAPGRRGLTEEQARAVICFDERVLLVASAGSGKTFTMVEKALYAVERRIAAAPDILLVAFNKKAAEELGVRLREALDTAGHTHVEIDAKTFHGLGHHIDGEVREGKRTVAKWSKKDAGAVRKLEQLFEAERRANPAFAVRWYLLRSLYWFDSPAAEAQEHRPKLRSARGEDVASLQELTIADWLHLHGIDYEYERAYEYPTATASRPQYHPDFYYPAIDTWHEHFALDAHGRPPPKFDDYLEGVMWKRRTHARYGTRFFETTSAEYAAGTLLDRLDLELRQRGLTPAPDPERTANAESPIKDMGLLSLVRKFASAAKSAGLDDAALWRRLIEQSHGAPPLRTALFLEVVAPLRLAWDEALLAENAVDYDDMMIAGCEHLESGRWFSPYTLVMADEFQDVSPARRRMIQALTGQPDRLLFAVGDDWQSINRFAGSDPTIMQRFEAVFGEGRTLQLTETFRFPPSIADVAGAFVMANDKQLRKSVRSNVPEPDTGPTLSAYQVKRVSELPAAVERRLAELALIVSSGGSERASVLVLGRYNADEERYLPKHCAERFADVLDIRFSTIHKLKGGEGEHVILPGLIRGKNAFPSLRADDPIILLVNPADASFEHAEERRLFYVALTRARSSLTMLTAKHRISPFLRELAAAGAVEIVDAEDPDTRYRPCPRCSTGMLVKRKGRRGPFYGCSGYPDDCRYTEPE